MSKFAVHTRNGNLDLFLNAENDKLTHNIRKARVFDSRLAAQNFVDQKPICFVNADTETQTFRLSHGSGQQVISQTWLEMTYPQYTFDVIDISYLISEEQADVILRSIVPVSNRTNFKLRNRLDRLPSLFGLRSWLINRARKANKDRD